MGAPWAIEKACGFLIYTVMFPVIVHFLGPVTTFAVLFPIQIAGYLALLSFYDSYGKDIFNIEWAKGVVKEKAEWILNGTSIFGHFLFFLVCAWQFAPPLTVLIMRPEGRKNVSEKEMGYMFAACLFTTVYWILISEGILSVPSVWKLLVGLFVS